MKSLAVSAAELERISSVIELAKMVAEGCDDDQCIAIANSLTHVMFEIQDIADNIKMIDLDDKPTKSA